jgi:hypothetical protein
MTAQMSSKPIIEANDEEEVHLPSETREVIQP